MAKSKPPTSIKSYSSVISVIWLVLLGIILCAQLWFRTDFFKPLDFEWLLDRYFLSQDIPHEVAPDRVFLTDGQIHLASGWLYAIGNNPILYNFQHPPLIKYFYGLSILGFSWPQLVQLGFGIGLVSMTFALGRFIFRSIWVGLLSSLLLVFDPVFIEVITGYLLDLGQAFFLLLYLYLMLFSKSYRLAGITLGFLLASKFWGSSLFLVGISGIYLLHSHKITSFKYLKHAVIAALTYMVIYLPAFIHMNGEFNLIFFELKRVKYWLNHSISSMPLASLILFLTGWYRTWWGDYGWTSHQTWSLLWPVSLFAQTLFGIENLVRQRSSSPQVLVYLLPIIYLIFLGFQAPFTRYFILILPLAYMGLSEITLTLIRKVIRQRRR